MSGTLIAINEEIYQKTLCSNLEVRQTLFEHQHKPNYDEKIVQQQFLRKVVMS